MIDDQPVLIRFERIPFPPSDNQIYANNFKNGRGRFKSKEMTCFEKLFGIWVLQNKEILEYVGPTVREYSALGLHIMLICDKTRVYCKDGSVKRFDAQNRCKALIDQLCLALGIDDRMIFKLEVEKIEAKDSLEGVMVDLFSVEPRTSLDILNIESGLPN